MRHRLLIVEMVVGLFSIILGFYLTALVWDDGYFVGAMMLIVTGVLDALLAVKELYFSDRNFLHWQTIFFMILRRTFFFLNLMLCTLVLATLFHLIPAAVE